MSCQQFWWRLLFDKVFLGPQGNYFVCRWIKWMQGWEAQSYPGLINTSTLVAEFGRNIMRTLILRLHCTIPAPHEVTSSRWQCSYLGWSGFILVHWEKVEVFRQSLNTSTSKTLKPEWLIISMHVCRIKVNWSYWMGSHDLSYFLLLLMVLREDIFKMSTPETIFF